jgi:hypothetical protein
LNERNQRQGNIRKKKGRRHGALKAGCGLKVNASSPLDDQGRKIAQGSIGRPQRAAKEALVPRSQLKDQAQPNEPTVK